MRQVSWDRAQDFAVGSGGLAFYETSAVTGVNIEKMFNKLAVLCSAQPRRMRRDEWETLKPRSEPLKQKTKNKCCA